MYGRAQLPEEKNKSGQLQATCGDVTGTIRFHAGKPLEASTSTGTQGAPAITEMLHFDSGSFVIDPNAKPPGTDTVERGFGALVLEDFFDS